MIRLSPAKINLGLRITGKREDDFHELHSIMIPIPFCDLIEITAISDTKSSLEFTQSGIKPDIPVNENLCVKALELFARKHPVGTLKIHLHKQIPFGAGLGGGSSNASTVIEMLNDLYGAPLSFDLLCDMAAELGSDCPFFLHHQPMLMEGRGELLSRIHLDLKGVYLVLLNPGLIISTAEAFQLVKPEKMETSLPDLTREPRNMWRQSIINDFEPPLFVKHPELRILKNKLYEFGAFYASLSGSGSSIYGLFKERPILPSEITGKRIWEGELKSVTQIQ